MVLEGVRLLEEALAARARVAFALVSPSLPETERGHRLYRQLVESDIPVFEVPPALLELAADTMTPQGVVAAVDTPVLPLPSSPQLLLVLDGWRDPGNCGTALRTALAAGADAVLLAPHTVDPTNPKVVRAAMGAHFRLPIRQLGWPELAELVSGMAVWVADAAGKTEYACVDWRQPAVLIVGGEAYGPSPEALALGNRVRIPMAAGVDSLNAAVAAAVVLFEAARQRRGAGPGHTV